MGKAKNAAVIVAAMACLELAAAAPDFKTTTEALTAISSTEDPAARLAVYGWLTNRLAASATATDFTSFTLAAGKAARAVGEGDSFAALCRRLVKAADPEGGAAVAASFAEWLSTGGDNEGALAVVNEALSPSSPVSGKSRVLLATKAAGILSSRLSRPAEADALLSGQLPLVAKDDAERRLRWPSPAHFQMILKELSKNIEDGLNLLANADPHCCILKNLNLGDNV